MPMYTAASPGNLLPKFSGPAVGGTIEHRASVLQKATGVVAAGYAAAGAHCVVGGAPTLGAAPTKPMAPRRTTSRATNATLEVTVPPFPTGSPRRHEAARARPAERPARRPDPMEPRT